MENKPLFDFSWPYKVDFTQLENLEIECFPAKVLYRSFFTFLRLPEIVVFSFLTILAANTGIEIKNGTNAQKN